MVTSRDLMTKSQFYQGEDGLEVGPLDSEDGAAFLRQLTKSGLQGADASIAETVSSRLDGIPLALVELATVVYDQRLNLQEFLDLYEDGINRRNFFDEWRGAQKRYQQSIASSWALNETSGPARTLLNVLSFLDPDYIYEEILIAEMVDLKNKSYPPTKAAYHKTLEELIQSSIVRCNNSYGEPWIHRLDQEAAQETLCDNFKALQETFDDVVSLLSALWPFIAVGTVGRAHKVGRWAKCARLHEHISHLRRVWVEI